MQAKTGCGRHGHVMVRIKADGRFLLRNSMICDIFRRSHLKNKILVHFRGGSEFQTDCVAVTALAGVAVTALAGILQYLEDLKRGTNKENGPKDIFEMASSYVLTAVLTGAQKYGIQLAFQPEKQMQPR
jgi:hypothetical protein